MSQRPLFDGINPTALPPLADENDDYPDTDYEGDEHTFEDLEDEDDWDEDFEIGGSE